jgi:hypothetical protein
MCHILLASDARMIISIPHLRRTQSYKKNVTSIPLLAWNLLCECCTNLIEIIENIFFQSDCIARQRLSENDVVRNRVLSDI